MFTTQLTSAQTQAINGSIRGRVSDATNAPVPAAQVTVRNDETGFRRSIDTSDDGYYVVPNLPIGVYTVNNSTFAPFNNKNQAVQQFVAKYLVLSDAQSNASTQPTDAGTVALKLLGG